MKTTWAIATVLVLLLAGCQKPTEVQITDESAIDVEDALDPDTSFDRASVDSTALLPREQQAYTGFFTVTAVRTDLPNETRRRIVARAVIEDKGRLIVHNGRKKYWGFLLERLRLNNVPMRLLPRFVGNLSAGFEYVLDLATFAPGQQYVFSADSIGLLAIEAPDVVTAHAPIAGQLIQRGRDLPLQWSGRGRVQIIISSFTPPDRVVPLLRLRPREDTGRVVLPRRILRGLPAGSYLFTFVLARRDERQLPGRFAGTLLVQASSIHNVMVDVR